MAIDYAAVKARLAQTKARLKKAGTTIGPKPGTNRYVLLPPYNEMGDWSHPFGTHFIKDAGDQIAATYICASRTHDAPCPVCNTMAEAQRTVGVSDPAMKALIDKAYASQKYLVSVLALDSDTPDTPQVLSLGKKAFEQLVASVDRWMAKGLWDETEPNIVEIIRAGTTQMDTSYTVGVSPDTHRLKKAVKPIDLAEFVKQESEAAEKKAVLALRAVAGLQLGYSGGGASKSVQPTESEFEDVPDLDAKPAATRAAAPAPARTPATTAAPELNADLDSLLADMATA